MSNLNDNFSSISSSNIIKRCVFKRVHSNIFYYRVHELLLDVNKSIKNYLNKAD